MAQQPVWEFVANLGDVNPLEYGGYFVYRDATGVYPEEGEYIIAPEGDSEEWIVYRFTLDRCKQIDSFLVPFAWDPSWPHPLADYQEWYVGELADVANVTGEDPDELRAHLCSEDPCKRARAYESMGLYFGFHEFDEYPFHLTREEIEARHPEFA
jgi:hypothetical protein